jgi:hypothetical protein
MHPCATMQSTPHSAISMRPKQGFGRTNDGYTSNGIPISSYASSAMSKNRTMPSISSTTSTSTTNNTTQWNDAENVTINPDYAPKDVGPKIITVPNNKPDRVFIAFFEHGEYSIKNFLTCIIGWRVRCISPRFEHCQLVFCWNPGLDQLVATFSTSKDNPSTYANTKYSNQNWCVYPIISLDDSTDPHTNLKISRAHERQAIFEWCNKRERVPFNNIGYYLNFLPPITCCPCLAYNARGSAYFCAEQVASCLVDNQIKEGRELIPHLTVPDNIQNALVTNGSIMTTVNIPRIINHSILTPTSKFSIPSSVVIPITPFKIQQAPPFIIDENDE